MTRRLAELAELVAGEVRGDGELRIRSVKSLDAAGPEDLSFLTSSRYREQAARTGAGAVLVSPDLVAKLEGKNLLIAADPAWALALILDAFFPVEPPPPGIHPTALIDDSCEIDPAAHVGAHAVIAAGSRVEAGAVVHPLVVVGRNCRIGRDAVLHPHVVLYDGTQVGERVILHAGVVLGSDGFGYAVHEGVHVKVPQTGRVVVEEDVEIGANSAVDRATVGETRIGAGSKVDNLVQVGHNVRVGRRCILCGQVGLAGSASLGDGVVMAGQAGAAGHLEVGDGAQVAAKSAVFKPVAAGQQVAGIPAIELANWRRQVVLLSRLEALMQRVETLEKRVPKKKGKPGGRRR